MAQRRPDLTQPPLIQEVLDPLGGVVKVIVGQSHFTSQVLLPQVMCAGERLGAAEAGLGQLNALAAPLGPPPCDKPAKGPGKLPSRPLQRVLQIRRGHQRRRASTWP